MPPQVTFPLDRVVAKTTWLDEVDSTNRFLIDQPPSDGGHAVVSWNQTGGRGRLQREWVSPKNKSLALSVELWRDRVPQPLTDQWRGSLSVVAGVCLAEAIRPFVDGEVSVKWPNDVLIDGGKVAGILGEIASDSRFVVGVGVNVWLDSDELPTSRASSLSLHGLSNQASVGVIVESFLTTLRETLTHTVHGLQGDTLSWVEHNVQTIGQQVRVDFPDGTSREAEATGIDPSGRLLVRFSGSDRTETIDAADIWHLRQASA